MKVQHPRSLGLASLTSLLIFMAGHGSAGGSSYSSQGCIPVYMSDGDCDGLNNNEECGYDGGDCCACTCISTPAYTCSEDGGYACVDPEAACVDDDDVTTFRYSDDASDGCLGPFLGDGDCDEDNNYEECGYDDGDCCECTCISTYAHTCGDVANGGFNCVDPSASCADDDDFYFDDDITGSYSYPDLCIDGAIGDGDCDEVNNKEECDYDGGDCCECTCRSTVPFSCGVNAYYDCIDPSASCVNDYVEAGTKTTVGVSANAYDTRASGDNGCMEDGCEAALTRDGISDDVESRWSCSQSIISGGRKCKIEFTFENRLDIADVEVAFWKGDERTRTLEVKVNGFFAGEIESYPGSTFNVFSIDADDVETLTFRSLGLDEDDWISLIEVRFMVKA